MTTDVDLSRQYYHTNHHLALRCRVFELDAQMSTAHARFTVALEGKPTILKTQEVMEVTRLGREVIQMKALKLLNMTVVYQTAYILRLVHLAEKLENHQV